MSELRDSASADIGRLLGLGGWGERLIFVLYAVTMALLSILTRGVPGNPIEVLTLVGVVAAGAIVTAPGAYPLPIGRTVALLLVLACCTAAGDSQLAATGNPGFIAWHFGAITFNLFALALRGRIAGAWIGMGLVCAVTLVWSTIVTGDPLHGVELIYGQAASLFAGTFFAILLRRTAHRILEFNRVERDRAGQEQLRRAGEDERELQVTQLRSLVEGPLRAIADGTATAADAGEFRLLEAALRDRIRGKALQVEPLLSAAVDARRHGSDVVLLDDVGDRSADSIDLPAAQWAAERITSTTAGAVTVRLSLENGERVLTVVTEGALPEIYALVPPA